MSAQFIDPAEKQNFRNELARMGHDPDDFIAEINTSQGMPVGDDQYLVHEEINVTRVSSRQSQIYERGEKAQWIAAALADIAVGRFDIKQLH